MTSHKTLYIIDKVEVPSPVFKMLLPLRLLPVSLLAFCLAIAAEKYTTKFDNINIDEVLRSDRLVNNYVKCLLHTGKCSPDGLELRNNLLDALTSDCSKCSSKQKDVAEKVLHNMYNKRKAIYDQVAARYDPQGIYQKKHDADIKRIVNKPLAG